MPNNGTISKYHTQTLSCVLNVFCWFMRHHWSGLSTAHRCTIPWSESLRINDFANFSLTR